MGGTRVRVQTRLTREYVEGYGDVETEWVQYTPRQPGRFLKGPFPWAQFVIAAKLPGRALALWLAIHHQAALAKRDTVVLSPLMLAELRISRGVKFIALHSLAQAGLIALEQRRGRVTRVRLLPVQPDTASS
jgi:hypothetical protein